MSEKDESKLRLFVAVLVPGEVKAAIAEAQQDLQNRLSAARVSWTEEEQFHLTLKFLGTVLTSELSGLKRGLLQATSRFEPLTVMAEGAGFFPGASRPRVIWVGLAEATGLLEKLQRAVDLAVQPFTCEEPEERFHAHVTIGRVKEVGGADVKEMRQWAERWSARVYGQWSVGSIALVQSKLSPNGATYRVIEEARLGCGGSANCNRQ